MRKIIIGAAVLGLSAFGAVAPAQAAGKPGDGEVFANQGDCISDGFFGNEPNIVGPFAPGGPQEQEPGSRDGRVVPSQSPGPQVTNPDGTVRAGATIGDLQRLGISVPEACRTLTQ